MALLQEHDGKVWAVVDLGNGRIKRVGLSKLVGMDPNHRLATALIKVVSPLRPYTQASCIGAFVRSVGGGLCALKAQSLPDSERKWQHLISRLYEFHFSRDDTG
ncbi:MAG TPA: hypothetical protein VGM47_09430, partial [Gammaproteobacteria bacterium]